MKTPVSGLIESVIADVNASDIPVVAIDLPSGLSADSPDPIGPSIEAELTITLAAPSSDPASARPTRIVGSSDVLRDIGANLLPQTWVLDSDHVVRQVIFGTLTWDALVRALTAASKSRLALGDRDVALS